jgi:hypothetical protein
MAIFWLLGVVAAVYMEVRVEPGTQTVFDAILEAKIDVDDVDRMTDRDSDEPVFEMIISDSDLANLTKVVPKVTVLHEDVEAFYASRLDSTSRARSSEFAGSDVPPEFELGSMGGYYTYEEVGSELDRLHTLYPNLISTKVSIGKSLQGRDIWMVRVSDNPEDDEDEPEMLYTGAHHAREPMGWMQAFYFMHWLGYKYGADPEATALVDSRELYFIPIVNPDGVVQNHRTHPNGGGMHRKKYENRYLHRRRSE